MMLISTAFTCSEKEDQGSLASDGASGGATYNLLHLPSLLKYSSFHCVNRG